MYSVVYLCSRYVVSGYNVQYFPLLDHNSYGFFFERDVFLV